MLAWVFRLQHRCSNEACASTAEYAPVKRRRRRWKVVNSRCAKNHAGYHFPLFLPPSPPFPPYTRHIWKNAATGCELHVGREKNSRHFRPVCQGKAEKVVKLVECHAGQGFPHTPFFSPFSAHTRHLTRRHTATESQRPLQKSLFSEGSL